MGLDGTLQVPVAAYPPLISPNASSFMYAVNTLMLQAELLTSSSLLLKLALVTLRILIIAAIKE
jgi:vesicle coat complex subunit